MVIANDKERVKAIRKQYRFHSTGCTCCKKTFRFKEMWVVYRDTPNLYPVPYYYCQNCMPTAEAVLHEIDTDAINYGIAGIDTGKSFKKDTTKVNEHIAQILRERALHGNKHL